LTLGRPRNVAASALSVVIDGSSAGTCHAPHTTATVAPVASAARTRRRM
jgi:hypothetical protein